MTKVAFVTGGARGLGRQMVLGLLDAGLQVVACDVASAKEDLERLRQDAPARTAGRLEALLCDVSSTEQCMEVVASLQARFGGVDILVNNAAIGLGEVADRFIDGSVRFYDLDVDFWRSLMDVNVTGAFRLAKLVAPMQMEKGWGRIVNISTSIPTMVKQGFSPYGPAKAALEAATAIWAKDLAGTGVTVNALLPGGAVDTRMVSEKDVEDRSRLIKPDVLVKPLVWLVSGAADQFTGRRIIANEWSAGAMEASSDIMANWQRMSAK